MPMTADNMVDLSDLAVGKRGDGPAPDYRVYFVSLDGSVCWTGANADSFKEACEKVEEAIGRRGVIGADKFELGEIDTPDLR